MVTIVTKWFKPHVAVTISFQVIVASEAERSEASSQSEPRFAKARELLFNVWGLEQGVSQKLSIFDIWCIEEKVFVFT